MFQWLVVPGALFAIGYAIVGPRIGQVPALRAGADRVSQMVAESSRATKEPEATGQEANKPIMTITVEPSQERPRTRRARADRAEEPRARDERRPTRRAEQAAPPDQDPASAAGAEPEAVAAPEQPPADPAGAGGGTTDGGTGG